MPIRCTVNCRRNPRRKKIAENIRQLQSRVKPEKKVWRTTRSLNENSKARARLWPPAFMINTSTKLRRRRDAIQLYQQFRRNSFGRSAGAEPTGKVSHKIGLGDETAPVKWSFSNFSIIKSCFKKKPGDFRRQNADRRRTQTAADDYAKIKILRRSANAKRNELRREFNRGLGIANQTTASLGLLASRYARQTTKKKSKSPDEDINSMSPSIPNTAPPKKRDRRTDFAAPKNGRRFCQVSRRSESRPRNQRRGLLWRKTKWFRLWTGGLALEPGNAENSVERLSYHIIKLEKRKK